MTGPIARILLRYLAGYLVLRGFLPAELGDTIANDPDLAAVVGGVLIAVSEGGYVIAKRRGWRT